MDINPITTRGGSPLLRELRRWERRSRRGERPQRALLAHWQQEVAAAQDGGDQEAPRLAGSLRAILRLGVESRLAGVEQSIDAGRPLGSILLGRREAAALRADLEAAATLGGRVGRARTLLSGLLGAQLAARLAALESGPGTASPAEAVSMAREAAALWDDLLEAEAQGTPDTAEFRRRLSRLHPLLDAFARTTSAAGTEIAGLASTVLTLASPSENLGRSLVKAWVERLMAQFAGRPGWEQFTTELLAIAEGEATAAKAATVTESMGRAGRSPMPRALAQILAFVRERDHRLAGFLANLVSRRRAEIDHPGLEMPLVVRTEIQLDWLEGHPNPWHGTDLAEKARAAASALLAEGVRVEFVPGRPIPAVGDEERPVREATGFNLPYPPGPLPLARLPLLEGATLVEHRPGHLEVMLPPAGATMAGPAGAEGFARGVARTPAAFAAGPPVTPSTTVRLQLDWVAGQDPWQRPGALMRAQLAAESLATGGVRLEFVRGREVPAARYASASGLRAADFVASGARGPVSLGEIALLEKALPLEQRPGLLHVILAPDAGEAGVPGNLPAGSAATAYGVPLERPLPALRADAGAALPETAYFGQPRSAGSGQWRSAPPDRWQPTHPDRVQATPSGGWPAVSARSPETARPRAERLSGEILGKRQMALGGATPTPATSSRAEPGTGFAGAPRVPGAQHPALHGLLASVARPWDLRGGTEDAPGPATSRGLDLRRFLGPAALRGQGWGQAAGRPSSLPSRFGASPGLLEARSSAGAAVRAGQSTRMAAGAAMAPAAISPAALSSPLGGPWNVPEGAPAGRFPGGQGANPWSATSMAYLAARNTPLPLAGGWGSGMIGRGAEDAAPPIGLPGTIAGGEGTRRSSPAPLGVRLEMDWVSGHDPWKHTLAIPAALEAARGLEDRGIRLELARGREVPAERYPAGTGMPAAAFSTMGPAGPVGLAELALLNRAVPLAQRPGLLHVLLAPGSMAGEKLGAGSTPATAPIGWRGATMASASAGSFPGSPLSRSVPHRQGAATFPGPYSPPDSASPGHPAAVVSAGPAAAGKRPASVAAEAGLPLRGALTMAISQIAQLPAVQQELVSRVVAAAGGANPPSPAGKPAPAGSAATVPSLAMPVARDRLAAALSNRSSAASPAASGDPSGPALRASAFPSPGGSTAPSVRGAGDTEAGRPDMDALSRQVYAILKQRLTVEHERSGKRTGRPW